jgi:lipopolysaccharide transport system permease protein
MNVLPEAEFDRIIRPKSGLIPIDYKEIWVYRELFWFLAWKEVIIRYKQTALGVLWALIQPLVTMLIFTFIFGSLAGFSKDTTAPYAIITLAGVVPWQFFSNAMNSSGLSLVSQGSLVTKVYFPRLILPISYILASGIDLAISMSVLFIMMGIMGITFSPLLFMLPVFILIAAAAALGAGLWFSAMNVKYRDVKHIIPFLVKIGLYISPVGFLSTKIPEAYRFWYSLNPMVGVIDGFRWCILGPEFAPYWPGFWVSVAMVLLILVSGAYYFRHVERSFADMM